MTITLELTDEEHRQLAERAERSNTSATELVMAAIRELLLKDETSHKSLIERAAEDSIEKNRQMLDRLA